MFNIFKQLKNNSWFLEPYDDLYPVEICRESGHKISRYCKNIDTIYIHKNGLKTPVCPYHKLIHLSKDRRYRVTSDCEKPQNMIHTSWFVLPPAVEWFYKNKNPLYVSLPPLRKNCNDKSIPTMEFIYPDKTKNIYVPKMLNGKMGRVIFEVAHRYPNSKLFWHLDNQFVGETFRFHQLGLNPELGNHKLTVIDEKGNIIKAWFKIISKKN